MADRPVPDPRGVELEAALDRAVAERDAWAQELFETNRFAAQLVVERQTLRDALDAATQRERVLAQQEAAQQEAARQTEAAHRERDQARQERDAALTARDRAEAEAHAAAALLQRVTSSTAWRATGPLRRVLAALRGR